MIRLRGWNVKSEAPCCTGFRYYSIGGPAGLISLGVHYNNFILDMGLVMGGVRYVDASLDSFSFAKIN